MKNIFFVLTALSLSGAALAESTTVTQPVHVQVKNVCTYNPGSTGLATTPPVDSGTPSVPLNMLDVNGRTYTQGNLALPDYKANGSVEGAVGVYIFRCTAGTNWNSPAYTNPKPVTLYLDGDATNPFPLTASSLVTEVKTPTTEPTRATSTRQG